MGQPQHHQGQDHDVHYGGRKKQHLLSLSDGLHHLYDKAHNLITPPHLDDMSGTVTVHGEEMSQNEDDTASADREMLGQQRKDDPDHARDCKLKYM